MSLRALDDRWLPAAAARVRSAADRVQQQQARGRAALRSFDVRSLDERWARGPLRGLQQHPVVGLVLVVALLAAGLGVAADRERGTSSRTPGPGPAATGPSYQVRGATLGPAVGADVTRYVRTATRDLLLATRARPAVRVALVSQTSYLTPEGEQAELNGFPVARVFVRAPAAGHEATPFPVEVHGDVLAALRSAYVETARSRAAAATSYQAYVDSLKGTSPEDKTFRDLYAAFARASGIEAREYAGDCACVYAALVLATPAQLLTLQARPGVRAVEVAPPGLALGQVQVQPLLPEVFGTVPRPTVGGQS